MLNIVISGAPGSGKGTQSDILIEEYGLTHLSTGDILREEIKAGTETGKKAAALINNGQLVSDEVITEMLRQKIDSIGETKGYIFDGYPRTLAQVAMLDEILAAHNTSVTCMIQVEVEHDILIPRLLNRAKTSGRADDNLETIKRRLEIYQTTTLPVMDHYRDRNRFSAVNNNSTVEACYEQTKAAVESYIN